MAPLNSRPKTILFAPEKVEGRAWPLTDNYPASAAEWDGGYDYGKTASAANAELIKDIRALQPTITPSFEKIDDEAASNSIGLKPATQGVRTGTCTFSLELSGDKSLSPTTDPSWSQLLEACGFRGYTGKLWTISGFGAVSGSTNASDQSSGEKRAIVGLQGVASDTTDGAGGTAAGSDARVLILNNVYEENGASGDTQLYVYELEGSMSAANDTEIVIDAPGTEFDGLVIKRATGGSFANSALSWVPQSRNSFIATTTALAGTIAKGKLMLGATSNALVRVVEEGATGATKIRFEVISGWPTDTGETFNEAEGGAETFAFAGTLGMVALGGQTLSIGLWEDGNLVSLKGARGDVTLTMTAGRAARLNFTFQGVYSETSDLDAPNTVTFGDAVAPRVVGATVFVDRDASYLPVLNTTTLTIANGLSMRESQSADEGVVSALAPARTVTGAMDPEATLEAVFPSVGRASTAAVMPMRVAWGSNSGNRFEVGMHQLMIRDAPTGDRGGKLIRNWAIQVYETLKDDEVYLLLT